MAGWGEVWMDEGPGVGVECGEVGGVEGGEIGVGRGGGDWGCASWGHCAAAEVWRK